MKEGVLKPFRGRRTDSVEGISYSLSRKGCLIRVEYELRGLLDQLIIDSSVAPSPERRSELWQHSCYELFLKESDPASEEYIECNFSPSGDWEVYEFSSYRTDMRQAKLTGETRIVTSTSENYFCLGAELDLTGNIASGTELIAGVSCIIEDSTGHKQYWALSHPRDKPDFHDLRSFLKYL